MRRNIYISAVLKDNMIVAYRISGNLKKSPSDYYKDFYYAGVKMSQNVDEEYQVEYMSVEVNEDISSELNNYIFNTLARKFYKQWKIHPKHFGQSAY